MRVWDVRKMALKDLQAIYLLVPGSDADNLHTTKADAVAALYDLADKQGQPS